MPRAPKVGAAKLHHLSPINHAPGMPVVYKRSNIGPPIEN